MLIEYALGCRYETTGQCWFATWFAVDERIAAESDTLEIDICWRFDLGNFSLPFRWIIQIYNTGLQYTISVYMRFYITSEKTIFSGHSLNYLHAQRPNMQRVRI